MVHVHADRLTAGKHDNDWLLCIGPQYRTACTATMYTVNSFTVACSCLTDDTSSILCTFHINSVAFTNLIDNVAENTLNSCCVYFQLV